MRFYAPLVLQGAIFEDCPTRLPSPNINSRESGYVDCVRFMRCKSEEEHFLHPLFKTSLREGSYVYNRAYGHFQNLSHFQGKVKDRSLRFSKRDIHESKVPSYYTMTFLQVLIYIFTKVTMNTPYT